MIITITPATPAVPAVKAVPADGEVAAVAAVPAVKAVPAVTIDTDDLTGLVATYGAASTGEKTKIRNAVTNGMMDAVRAMDMTLASAFGAMSDAIKSVASSPKVEIDYNQVLADRIIGLRYAAHLLWAADVTPDGIDITKIDRTAVDAIVDAYVNGGDSDRVTDAQAAIGKKLAGTKITRTAERGSVEAHIETAFAELPVGSVLTISQIRTRSGAASDGAIAVRLYPGDKADGTAKPITLDMKALGIELADVDGTRAVRKVA